MTTRLENPRRWPTLQDEPAVRGAGLTLLVALATVLAAGRADATPFAYIGSGTNVDVVDTATNTVVATVPVGTTCGGVAVSPDGAHVYLTCNSGALRVIDTTSNTATQSAGIFSHTPTAIAVHPNGTRVYVVDGPDVRVIDTATLTVVASIHDPSLGATTMAINPAGTRLYVGGGNNGVLIVMDITNNTVVTEIGGLAFTYFTAITPNGAKVYTGNLSGYPLHVIDTATNTLLTNIPVNSGVAGLAINPAGTRLYKLAAGSSSMDVIDTTTDTIVTTVGGLLGAGIAVNPAGTRAYFDDRNGTGLQVFDTASNTVVAAIPIPSHIAPEGLFVGPFCPNACSDGNPCTTDRCNIIGGCGYTFNTGPCASDGNQCTDDVCDGTGNCTHPNSIPGSSCDDGLFCDGTDTCDGSGGCNVHTGDPCAGGPECAQTCNEIADNCLDPVTTACTSDGNVCTDDHCDGAGTCIHTDNTASCDDGLFCDGIDTCAGGTCHHTGDPCTGGSECANLCNEAADNCFEPAGAACTTDANVCTLDVCDGSGACTHPAGNAGTVCRPATGSCDVAEACTGTSPTCPPDAFQPDTTPCSDGNACTTGETCTGGVCGNGSTVVCPLCQTCDTVGGCIVGPRPGCKHPVRPGKANILFKDRTPDDLDQVKWTWSNGQATTFAQLGNPVTTDDYALCIFDSGENLVVSFPAPAGGMCGKKPCWKQMGAIPTGFKYHDATRTQGGLDTLLAKSGIDNKAKMTLKAKGPNIQMPSLSFSLPLTTQLQSENGSCWEAAFQSSGVKQSTATDFKAKGQ
jgi:DNA-binding beta-propeller fold protein YncE